MECWISSIISFVYRVLVSSLHLLEDQIVLCCYDFILLTELAWPWPYRCIFKHQVMFANGNDTCDDINRFKCTLLYWTVLLGGSTE